MCHPHPHSTKEEGERVGTLSSTVNWRPVGAPGRSQLSCPLAPPPTAPPPPTTEALAKSLSAYLGSVCQLKDFTLLYPTLG